MIYLFAGILLFLAILLLKKGQKIINPVVLFSILWAAIFLLSSLRLFGMIPYSDFAVLLLGLGTVSFSATGTIYYLIKTKKEKDEAPSYTITETVRYPLINIFLILGLVLITPVAIKVTSLLLTGTPYQEIRSSFYSYGSAVPLIPNETLFTVFNWGLATILATTTPIILTDIVSKRKLQKLPTLLLIILTILYLYTTAGRSQLILIVIYTIVALLLNNLRFTKKLKKVLLAAALTIVAIIITMSALRGNSNNSLLSRLYAYFSLPVPYFSEVITQVDKNNYHTDGLATAYGPYLFIQKAIKATTGYKLENASSLDKIINFPQNDWIRIYNDIPNKYNAYKTMFFHFYLDFRTLGVVMFSALYGLILEAYYLYASKQRHLTTTAIYAVLATGLFFSFIHWQFAAPTAIIAIILIALSVKRTKILLPKNHKNDNVERILVFGVTDNPGGTEAVIMNYYRHFDHQKVQLDFLCNTQKVAYSSEIKSLGGKIYHITARSKNLIKYRKDLKKFFENHASEYDTIWVNVSSLANIDYLKYAKAYGIKRRIIHCHNSSNMDSPLRGLLHKYNRNKIADFATDFWSCDESASSWFYGKDILKSPKYLIVKNAIDTNIYKYNTANRQKIRTQQNVKPGTVVLGNIGRLHFQKNQSFLLDIFNEYKKLNPDSELWLVGDGPDQPVLEEKVKHLQLTDSVKFLGVRNDTPAILSALDYFIFPSVFEGFSLSLLEAEASGLPCFISSTVIPKSAQILPNLCHYIPLSTSSAHWAKQILNTSKPTSRTVDLIAFEKAGLEISTAANLLAENLAPTQPLVSIIITTSGRLNLFKRALASAKNQTYKNTEIIIIDDNSTDGTESYCKSQTDLTYLRIPVKDHKNGSFARNLGLKNAKGTFIAYLDDDDEWFSDKIENQVRKMEQNPNLGAVYASSIIEYNHSYAEESIASLRGNCAQSSLTHIITSTSTILFSKNALEKIGGWDENLNFWQDTELLIRLCQQYQIDFIAKPEIIYRIILQDKNRLSNNVAGFKETLVYINHKHQKLINHLSPAEKIEREIMILNDLARRYYQNGDLQNCKSCLHQIKNLKPTIKNILKYQFTYIHQRKIENILKRHKSNMI